MSAVPRICVVGSANVDLISYAPRLPKLGETLTGTRFATGFGGKGANQAVMAAKLGAEVAMVTKLGDDAFGRDYLANFVRVGIDTTYVGVSGDASTGVAPIWVDEPSGNNAIIIVPGTNFLLTPADVDDAADAITGADVLVCQWEIPLDCVVRAFAIARDAGVFTIFNPAPAQPEVPPELLATTDLFCPNESETELLTGLSVATLDDVERAARSLIGRGVRRVVCTLGERGALYVSDDEVVLVPAERVDALDTTGAGDAFVGSLAFFVARGLAVPEAMARAARIATMTVLKPGTQSSFPSAADLPPGLL
jgi:ribokinase